MERRRFIPAFFTFCGILSAAHWERKGVGFTSFGFQPSGFLRLGFSTPQDTRRALRAQ